MRFDRRKRRSRRQRSAGVARARRCRAAPLHLSSALADRLSAQRARRLARRDRLRPRARPARRRAADRERCCRPDFAAGAPWAAELHLTPDGRFLYASERRSSTLASFAVDAARGTLTPLATTPTEAEPRGFAITPDGRFLFAVGQASHRLSRYAIDSASGALTQARRPAGRNQSELGRDRRAAAIERGPRSPSPAWSRSPSAMGIGRFAFTPILPMMLHDGVVDLHAASWLASANYIGYLIGALGCTLQPRLWARVPRLPPIDAPLLVRTGLVGTALLTLAMARAGRRRSGRRCALPPASPARSSSSTRRAGASRSWQRAAGRRSAARCSPGRAPASSPAACSRARWSRGG